MSREVTGLDALVEGRDLAHDPPPEELRGGECDQEGQAGPMDVDHVVVTAAARHQPQEASREAEARGQVLQVGALVVVDLGATRAKLGALHLWGELSSREPSHGAGHDEGLSAQDSESLRQEDGLPAESAAIGVVEGRHDEDARRGAHRRILHEQRT
tara:strand:- start:58 stop:528 length:471 start_codon:yes stop_codon:yes gene_type:complete